MRELQELRSTEGASDAALAHLDEMRIVLEAVRLSLGPKLAERTVVSVADLLRAKWARDAKSSLTSNGWSFVHGRLPEEDAAAKVVKLLPPIPGTAVLSQEEATSRAEIAVTFLSEFVPPSVRRQPGWFESVVGKTEKAMVSAKERYFSVSSEEQTRLALNALGLKASNFFRTKKKKASKLTLLSVSPPASKRSRR